MQQVQDRIAAKRIPSVSRRQDHNDRLNSAADRAAPNPHPLDARACLDPGGDQYRGEPAIEGVADDVPCDSEHAHPDEHDERERERESPQATYHAGPARQLDSSLDREPLAPYMFATPGSIVGVRAEPSQSTSRIPRSP